MYGAWEKKNQQFGIYQAENSDRSADLHRLKAAWYKIVLQIAKAGMWHSFCKVETRWLLVLFIRKFRTYLFLGLLPLLDLLSNVLASPWFFSHFRGSDHSCSLAVLFIIKKMHIMHPKFCISLDFNLCATTVTPRRNWEKMVTKNKAERKQSVLLAIQKLRISPVDTCNIGGHVKVSLLLIRQVVTITPQRFESFLS